MTLTTMNIMPNYSPNNEPDFGELEAYKDSGGQFYKPYRKTYEDVEHEQDLEELKEQQTESNDQNKTS